MFLTFGLLTIGAAVAIYNRHRIRKWAYFRILHIGASPQQKRLLAARKESIYKALDQ